MFLTILLILFLLLILCFLFLPIVLFIDTSTSEYYIKLKGLAKASIETDSKELLRIKLKILFFNYYFFPLKKNSTTRKKKRVKKKVKKNETRKMTRIRIKKGLRILSSFNVKKVILDIDTGNWILNAKLYPLFGFLNHHIGSFNVNFSGMNRMALYMQNRPINILKSLIKT